MLSHALYPICRQLNPRMLWAKDVRLLCFDGTDSVRAIAAGVSAPASSLTSEG